MIVLSVGRYEIGNHYFNFDGRFRVVWLSSSVVRENFVNEAGRESFIGNRLMPELLGLNAKLTDYFLSLSVYCFSLFILKFSLPNLISQLCPLCHNLLPAG